MASEAICRRLREELFRRLHHLRAEFFDDADTGDLVQRCSSDVETVRVFLSTDVVEIGRASLLVLTVVPILFWLNVDLAWFSICLLPLLPIGAYVFFSKIKHLFEETDRSEGEMTAVLQENLTGIRVVRAFAQQERETQRFGRRIRAFRDNHTRLARLMGVYYGAADLLAPRPTRHRPRRRRALHPRRTDHGGRSLRVPDGRGHGHLAHPDTGARAHRHRQGGGGARAHRPYSDHPGGVGRSDAVPASGTGRDPRRAPAVLVHRGATRTAGPVVPHRSRRDRGPRRRRPVPGSPA